MSVTAKFLADFTDFQTAVQKAEVSLKSFETGAGKVSTALNKMADSFSGRKIIQDAELATKAVTDIGGATKLTESEHAKLNAQLTEALAKYKALGLQAPDDMLKLQKETQAAANAMAKVPAQTTSIISSLGKMASAVGIGFSIGAVVNFGKSVIDSASQIHDLAEQLGISAEATQGFKFAAEQAGSSIDTVGTAITKMNKNLAEGDASTIKALETAGLKFADIRNERPEDAFLDIADAIQKIPDPMVQTQVALQLFGRSAAELLPAIKEGFRETSESASKMSNEAVNGLEKLGDAWDSLKARITNATGEMINDALNFLNVWKRMRDDIDRSTPNAPKAIDLGGLFGAKGADAVVADVEKVEGELNKIRAALDAAAEAHAKLIQNTRNQIFGTDAINAAKTYVEALGSIHNLSRVSIEDQKKINEVMEQAIRAYQRQGQIAPESIRAIWAATVDLSKLLPVVEEGFPRGFERMGEAAGKVGIPLENLITEGIRGNSILYDWLVKTGKTMDGMVPKIQDVKVNFGDLSQALAQLAQVSGGTFSGMISQLASLVAAANSAKKSIDEIQKGKKEAKEGSTLAGILEISAGITGLISSAIAAGKAIANLFDRNKGRDLVEDFAKSFGGFDQLHNELLKLGDEGEQLWIKLTQGVGRNNPEQAQRVIDEVIKALDGFAAKSDEAKGATEEQAQATIETATEAAKALEELGGKLDLNKEAWKDWGAVVTGQLQAVADAIRALPLPAPAGGSASLPFSAGGGTTKVQVNAPVYLDGNVLTEAVAYHTLN